MHIFVDNLLPVLLSIAIGFVLGRTLRPDLKTASRLSFYVFSPCLVFISLVQVQIGRDEFGQLALFSVAVCATMGLIALLCGRLLGLNRELLVSLVIVSVLVNSGNYGLAATKFAFGDDALPRALVCFVFSTIITYTAGVLLASMGKASAAEAFRNLLGVPAFYGLIAAAVVRQTGYELPLFLVRTATLLSDAAIPSMLIVLGLQIAEIRGLARGRVALICAAGFLQLVLTPLVALLLVQFIGLSGIARQAAVLQASMPAAVITTVLAVEYDLDQSLITGAVFLTTLLSPLTLTPLIAYLLRSG